MPFHRHIYSSPTQVIANGDRSDILTGEFGLIERENSTFFIEPIVVFKEPGLGSSLSARESAVG
jgi:hypothetical protein